MFSLNGTRDIRKSAVAVCKNTDKDQLSGNLKAGQRHCVCIVDSFLKFGILSLYILYNTVR